MDYLYSDILSLTDDGAVAFFIIPFFLNLTGFRNEDPKIKWRQNMKDIALSFIIHAKIHENLREIINLVKTEQINLYSKENPYIVCCGKLNELSCCHAIFCGVIYVFKLDVEAVDYLFKLFFVVNQKWPAACNHV
ncbi:hypothetical protein QAD02_003204 [Eretmocerus hayati]|uniref:Uncharacterized protein n=1 Tax=Eretmocerus hayati TaxID=131215 RepID=A0ACC2NL87_9HYME|nr:hypothetical protein QAD02_003204 [Eretmocerus hayati]